MSIETEIKIKIGDPADFCRRLEILDARRLSGRNFEDNHLLDFPGEKLRLQNCILRVRSVDGRGVLTYKGAPQPDGVFKTREELETGVDDAAMVLRMLERIGMQVRFRYQKYRQEFEVAGVHVAVDETPIGNYAEMEGAREEIRLLAGRMGIEESCFIGLSYYALYAAHCRKNCIAPGFMVF